MLHLVIIMLVYRRMLTTRLHGKVSCLITNNGQKQQQLFVQSYNLEVHDVIKYTRKLATDVLIISRASQLLRDVISRSLVTFGEIHNC